MATNESDAFDVETMLCPWCSVMHSSAPCERCRKLIASGKNRGGLPSFMIPRAEYPSECWACHPPDPEKHPNPANAKFCRRHIEASQGYRRVVPLEFNQPQVPRAVAMKRREEWFP